jgi:hypothetical protein
VTADVHVDAEASDVEDAALDAQIAGLEAEIAELDARATARDNALAATEAEIAVTEAKIAALDAEAAASNIVVAGTDAESAVGEAEAAASDADVVAEEVILPIPPVAGLRECAAEQLTLTLCNEKGQLMAQPMVAVLRQLNSLADMREVDYFTVLLQKPLGWHQRAPASKLPTPEWFRKARDYGAARLRKETKEAGQTAWDLNGWVCRLAALGDTPISLAQTAELSKALGALITRVPRSDPRLKEGLERLQVQVVGSAAAQHRAANEDRLYRRYAPYQQPGTRSERRVDLGVGAVAGVRAGVGSVSTGASAGITLGVSRSRALGNDDEGFVQESEALGCSVAGHGGASLGGAARVQAAAKVSARKTTYTEYDGVRHLVRSTDSKVQREKLGKNIEGIRDVPFKLRWLAHLTELQNKAAFQDEAFSRAIGGIKLRGAEGLYRVRSGLRPVPQRPPAEGVAMRVAVRGDAEASVGLPDGFGLRAGVSGGVAATHVEHEVLQPFWVAIGGDRPSFRHLGGEGFDDPARADALDLQRRQQVIELAAVRLAPALAQLDCAGGALSGPAKRHERASFALSLIHDRGPLLRILRGMEDQFDLYCLAAREVAAGKREAAALMRDFERIWQVSGREREVAYIQSVCLAHNAVALRLRQLAIEHRARGDEEAVENWQDDWARLDAFWSKLRTPDLPHQQSELLPYIAFRDVLSPSTFDRHISLSLGASGGWSVADSAVGLGVGGNVSVSAQFQRVSHPNYLREGDYIDLKFDLGGSSVIAAQYGAVLQALNGLSSRLALPPEVLENAFALTGTTPLLAASAEGGVQLLLRLFRPGKWMGDDAEYRLQFARVLGRSESGLSAGEVTVPVGPVSAAIEAGARVSHIRMLEEWLGDTTLTYVMLRHNRMHTHAPHDEDGEWSDFTFEHRKDFEKMFAALADPESPVSKEGALLMDQVVRGMQRPTDRTTALIEQQRLGIAAEDFQSSKSELDFDYAMLCLERVLARQFVHWKVAKAESRTHCSFDDRIRRVP